MHILNRVILSPTYIAGMQCIVGQQAIEILRQQRYTHIFIDDDGYIDALSPLGEPIRRYRLFMKKDVEVRS